jgi:type II secretory pathway pseudopilin PulG
MTAIIVIVSFNFITTDPGESFILETFKGGNKDTTITFSTGGSSDNSTHLFIETGAPVQNGLINVKGLPDGNGEYPTQVSMDVGDDNANEWEFGPQGDFGYGSFGKQNVYVDSSTSKKLIVPASGFGELGKIKLPKNATVTKAVFDMTYGTDVLTINPARYNLKDATTHYGTNYVNTNYGTYMYLHVSGWKTNAFLQFNLNSIPANVEVHSADLNVYSNWWWGGSRTYGAYRVTEQWWENNVTWNNRPNVDSSPLDSFTDSTMGWKVYNVSSAVINWKASTWNNYGVCLKETSNNTDGCYVQSNDNANANRPKLIVDYIKYPDNPGVRIGMSPGIPDWSFGGKLQSVEQTKDLKAEINSYLATAPSEKDSKGNEMVEIPFNVTCDNTGGIVVLKNLQIEYDYTHTVNITSSLNYHVPDDQNEYGYVEIPIRFTALSGGKLLVDKLYVVYNHRPLLKSMDEPTITSMPDFTFPEDSDIPKAIDLAYYFQDDWDDNRSMIYRMVWNGQPGYLQATINQDEPHYLDIKSLVTNWTGSVGISINCTDSGGRSIKSDVFNIIFEPVNDKPVFFTEIPEIIFDEDKSFPSFALDEGNYFKDAEGDTIYFDFDIDPLNVVEDEKLLVAIDNDNKLMVSAASNYHGSSIPLWIYADDGIYDGIVPAPGESAEVAKYGSGKPYSYQEVLVTVNSVNDFPVWTNIHDIYIDEDEVIDNHLNLTNYVSDIETPTDDLILSVFYNENNSKIKVEIDTGKNLDISFEEENYIGSTFVNLEAEDSDGGKSYETFSIISRSVNDLPKVQITSHKDGQSVYGKINLEGIASDVDGYVTAVDIRFDSEETWEALTGTGYWTYLWDTSLIGDGIHQIHLRAMDNLGEYSLDYTMSLNVANAISPNDPPVVAITLPENGTVVSNGKVTIRGTAKDPQAILKYVQLKLEDDEDWRLAAGTIDWYIELNTSALSNGMYKIFARSYDGRAYSTEKNITIQVVNPKKTVPDDPGTDTTDKETSGDFFSSNSMLLIIIVIVIIIIIAAIAGVMNKKKKREEAEKAKKQEEERVAAEAAAAAAAAQQIPPPVPLPGLPPQPAPVQPSYLPPTGMPQPTQVSYPAPTQVPVQIPQLPPGQPPAPTEAVPQVDQPYPAQVPPPTQIPVPPPPPPPPPVSAPSTYQPGVPPSRDAGVIDIQSISISSSDSEGEPGDKEPQPPQEAGFTKPVPQTQPDAFSVDIEYDPATGQYSTKGKPKQVQK